MTDFIVECLTDEPFALDDLQSCSAKQTQVNQTPHMLFLGPQNPLMSELNNRFDHIYLSIVNIFIKCFTLFFSKPFYGPPALSCVPLENPCMQSSNLCVCVGSKICDNFDTVWPFFGHNEENRF